MVRLPTRILNFSEYIHTDFCTSFDLGVNTPVWCVFAIVIFYNKRVPQSLPRYIKAEVHHTQSSTLHQCRLLLDLAIVNHAPSTFWAPQSLNTGAGTSVAAYNSQSCSRGAHVHLYGLGECIERLSRPSSFSKTPSAL